MSCNENESKTRIIFFVDDKTKDVKVTAASEIILHGLKKYTDYNITILAYTNGGDGKASEAISCHTEQDVPGPPMAVKASVMSVDSVLLSWQVWKSTISG